MTNIVSSRNRRSLLKPGTLRRGGYASDEFDDYARSVPILIPSVVDADLSRFEKNPVILWAFDDTKMPVARAEQITQGPDGLRMVACFATAGGNPFAEELWNGVRERVVRAVGAAIDPTTRELLAVSFVTVNPYDEDAGTPALGADDEAPEVVDEEEGERAAKASDAGRALANHRHTRTDAESPDDVIEPLGPCVCYLNTKGEKAGCMRTGCKRGDRNGPRVITEICDEPNNEERADMTTTNQDENLSARDVERKIDAEILRLDAQTRVRRISKEGEQNAEDLDTEEGIKREITRLRNLLRDKRSIHQRKLSGGGNLVMEDTEDPTDLTGTPEEKAEKKKKIAALAGPGGNWIMKDRDGEQGKTSKVHTDANEEHRFDANELAEIERLVLDAKGGKSDEPYRDANGRKNVHAFDPLVARMRAERLVLDARDASSDPVGDARQAHRDRMHNAWRG